MSEDFEAPRIMVSELCAGNRKSGICSRSPSRFGQAPTGCAIIVEEFDLLGVSGFDATVKGDLGMDKAPRERAVSHVFSVALNGSISWKWP